MSDVQKSNGGRTKTLTDSKRKLEKRMIQQNTAKPDYP
jgi:hypothetical protein